jgi:hypothetical protein
MPAPGSLLLTPVLSKHLSAAVTAITQEPLPSHLLGTKGFNVTEDLCWRYLESDRYAPQAVITAVQDGSLQRETR